MFRTFTVPLLLTAAAAFGQESDPPPDGPAGAAAVREMFRGGHGDLFAEPVEPGAARPGTGMRGSGGPLSAARPGGAARADAAREAGFNRLFGTDLPPLVSDVDDLRDLGAALAEPGGLPDSELPAVYTYFGQFLDHDITFDPAPLSVTVSDAAGRRNFRDPSLQLDSVYGFGPEVSPYLYRREAPSQLLVGETAGGLPEDLPRLSSGLAVTGDPRNDENLIIAQLQAAFLKAHNRVAEGLTAGGATTARSPFELARETIVWHYQWIVLNDFLGRVIGDDRLFQTLTFGPERFDRSNSDLPVEFSGAAYRFGHSLVRPDYNFNADFPDATLVQLFQFTGGGGLAPIPDSWVIDWPRFIDPAAPGANFARPFDPYLAGPLMTGAPAAGERNLAVRNLVRGRALGLPSGQAAAGAIGADPLTPDELRTGPEAAAVEAGGFHLETPLWYYILKEAEVREGSVRLGEVGSFIVAETFVGLMLADDASYLRRQPNWSPTLTLSDGTAKVDSLPNLIRYSRGE